MNRIGKLALGLGALAISAGVVLAQTTTTAPTTTVPVQLQAQELFAITGTNATNGFGPVLLTSPPGDPRLFVINKAGEIRIIENGAMLETPFITIPVTGGASTTSEQGLLGLAFHPNYAQNGLFYVNLTCAGNTAPTTCGNGAGFTFIRQYKVSADNPNVADPTSGVTILQFAQSAANHNGGWLGFGPDGYLYIPTGDGGAGAPNVRGGVAQDPNALLGKVLRIDVNTTSEGRAYGIPAGNPYAAGGGAPEVFVRGFRNPFRASFDGNFLYVADVGEVAGDAEEINVIDIRTGAGGNYGWPIVTGKNQCAFVVGGMNNERTTTCDTTGLIPSTFEYPNVGRGAGGAGAVIGGYVYRGSAIPELQGHYFFGDWVTGQIWSFRYVDGQAVDVTEWTAHLAVPGAVNTPYCNEIPDRCGLGAVMAFGTDSQGELYVLTTTYRGTGSATNAAQAATVSPNPVISRAWKLVKAAPTFTTFSITQQEGLRAAGTGLPAPVAGSFPAGGDVLFTVSINGVSREYAMVTPNDPTDEHSSSRLNILLTQFAALLNGQKFGDATVTAGYEITAIGRTANGRLTIATDRPATYDTFTVLFVAGAAAGPGAGTTSINYFSSLTR